MKKFVTLYMYTHRCTQKIMLENEEKRVCKKFQVYQERKRMDPNKQTKVLRNEIVYKEHMGGGKHTSSCKKIFWRDEKFHH